ncbi:unnamed protein product [Notodromas monacha]|uniref:EF-hand domain-containing protein n=1 Tax=Notodromas monacha TaxID=399045 RepID=A0A7R9BXR2_9CRUS|nr:unnamed protein product [Notodromas monacha]CAG0922351.1 unnamed protein product [Notodromas monacha]
MSLPELQQNPLVQRVIDIFDADGNGEVDFKGLPPGHPRQFHQYPPFSSISAFTAAKMATNVAAVMAAIDENCGMGLDDLEATLRKNAELISEILRESRATTKKGASSSEWRAKLCQEFIQGVSQFSVKGDKESKLRFAFRIYDMDNDGFISNGELYRVLKMMVGNNLKDAQLQQIVDKTILFHDKDEDGKISFEEFCSIVGNTDVHKKMVVDV